MNTDVVVAFHLGSPGVEHILSCNHAPEEKMQNVIFHMYFVLIPLRVFFSQHCFVLLLSIIDGKLP